MLWVSQYLIPHYVHFSLTEPDVVFPPAMPPCCLPLHPQPPPPGGPTIQLTKGTVSDWTRVTDENRVLSLFCAPTYTSHEYRLIIIYLVSNHLSMSMSMSLSSKCSHPIILNMVYLYHYINYLTQCTHSVTTVISTLYPSVYCHCHLAAYLISSILSCLTITHSLHSLLL